jgi:hypothetical protein
VKRMVIVVSILEVYGIGKGERGKEVLPNLCCVLVCFGLRNC